MKSPHLFGKYLLLERVSVGGMAEIFIAKAFGVEGFERILAIKKILPTMAEDEEFITMFIDEARICSALNHANIVHIHELGRHDGAYFIAMEYVSGLDLKLISEVFRRERQALPIAQAVFIASKVCEGLDYAHRAKDGRGQPLNIVHRDISPQNILISYEGELKLIDFGIAKAANRRQETQVGILKGKFGYMSPEQALGKPIDRRSDLFAVGVILYEMLTGDRLFVGESDFSVIDKVRNVRISPPRELNPQIPKDLEKVLLKALAKEPDERYQWGSELQEDLTRFLVTDGQVYTTKQLSAFMKEVFAEEIAREAERMERFARAERPEQLEDSSVEEMPRRKSSKQIPIAAPPTSRTAPAAPTPAPQKRADSGGFRAARPPAPPADASAPKKAIPFSAVPTSERPAPSTISRQPTAPGDLPSVVVEGVDRTQVFDAMEYQESLDGAPPEEGDPQGRPKAQVVIGAKVVTGPTVIGAIPEREPPRLEPVSGPLEESEGTPLQGRLLEDPEATPAAPGRSPETNPLFSPSQDAGKRPGAPLVARIDTAPAQAVPGFGPNDEASFEPTRLRASGEHPSPAQPQPQGDGKEPEPAERTLSGMEGSPDPWGGAGGFEERADGAQAAPDPRAEPSSGETRVDEIPAGLADGSMGQPPGGEASAEDRPAEEEGVPRLSEPTRVAEAVPEREPEAPEPTRIFEDEEGQASTDPVSRHALYSDPERTPLPQRIPPGLGFDDDDIPERPTDTRSGETHVGPAPRPPGDDDEPNAEPAPEPDEPSEDYTDPSRTGPPVLYEVPPAGADKAAGRAKPAPQVPARRPTSTQRSPSPWMANPRTRWTIIGASAAGLLVALGLLAFATSGGSESALLVIAEPRESAKIAVDGLGVPNGQVVMPFPEGAHELVVSAEGYQTDRQHIRVAGRSTFQIRLVPEPPAPAPQPPPVEPPPVEPPPPSVASPEPSVPQDTPPPTGSTPDGGTEPDKGTEPAPATEKRKPHTERPPDVRGSRATNTRPPDASGSSKKKKTGTLACTSNPLGAEVFIDGRPTGRRTPVPFGSAIELAAGKHKLTLKAGSKSVTATIEIREGEVTAIRNAVLQ